MKFTVVERQMFLKYIEEGHDPSSAARLVDENYTGRMFRRLISDKSIDYDPEFAAEFLVARAKGRENLIPPQTVTDWKTTNVAGHTKAHYLTPDQLDVFIEAVERGTPPSEAAKLVNPPTSLNQITRRSNQDIEFAERYAEAQKTGYPNFQEWLRATIYSMAGSGNYSAAKDLALIHLPEWAKLAKTQVEIGGQGGAAIRLLAEQALPSLPPEMLDEMLAAMEQRALPPGEEVAA